MITVELALFAGLSSRYPTPGSGREPRSWQLDEGATVRSAAELLGIQGQPRITFVNGRHAPDEQELCEGDRIAIFPPIAGG